MTTISLHWQGPYEWFGFGATSIFGGPSAETVGIYVWTVQVGTRYRCFYIGQTVQAFAARHHDHFREYWGGAYTFYEPESFSRGVLARLYAGYAYKKPRWQQAIPFHAAFTQYVEPLVEHLKAMRLWIAECPEPTRIQRRIEAALMDLLYARHDPIGDFLQPGLVRHSRRQDEEPILVRQTRTDILEGLPGDFEA